MWTVLFLLGWDCPIAYLIGGICPACGSTRAILALLQGDFNAYLHYQPMALPLIVAVGLCLHLHIIKNPFKGIVATGVALILLTNIFLYVNRLVTEYPL